MQVERLVQMIFYIVNHEKVTAHELGEYFDVSTRTIYRDIDTLTLIGIPIITAKGTGGGISLMDGYTIDKSTFSQKEQQSIYQGLQILQATKFPAAEATLNKIGALFKEKSELQWLEVDFTYWGSEEKEKIRFADLQHAILNKYVITFQYFNSELQASTKKINPLRLVFKSHTWYILGYCHSNQELRVFRLSRMRHISITPETFDMELPKNYSMNCEDKERGEFPTIKLKFSSEIAHKIYDHFQESQVSLKGGSYIVEVQYELNNWLFHYLLSFGKYVEVLEPEILRTMLKEKAFEIVKLYE